MEVLAILMFLSIFVLILYGYPVAFTLGGISVIYALLFLDSGTFAAYPPRVMGVMNNQVLLAVPLFIFMGIMLEKSGLAESLLETMSMLFARINGGLAISVVLVGALLAASTGIVGATVITMGLISLPTMLKRGYQPALASGTIAASGTLGQIIPPSVVLVLLGSVLNVSVGDLFAAAVVPGLVLVGAYLLYIIVVATIFPAMAPPLPKEEVREFMRDKKVFWGKVFKAFLMPLVLIVSVLGSIFMGIASPTEAAAVGALGASGLTVAQGKFSMQVLKAVVRETTHLTTMVFIILLGATTFSFVFREMNGDQYLTGLIASSDLSPMGFLFLVMLIVFIAGFFIDFIEIIFIIVPVVAPVFRALEVDLIWIGILLALNLQTSFLTPPFGFSLFYLKGVAPDEVTTSHLYKGIIPFVVIQLILLFAVVFFPEILS
ncbi:MAG: TRAP transporter large permease subunit [Saprospiraceae bacterium]|jgi:tripartite ATP-independent transporter DctM subunit|nr:TRAP transporter large permease subunit [Saprospiraceae bacterium]